MNVHRISVVLIVLCFLNTFVDGSDNPTDSTGSDVSINCGSSGTLAARNGREWIGDVQQRYSSGLQVKGSSTMSSINHKSVVTDPIPYESARASRSQFSYAFQVDPGEKIIRLHFNPVPYRGFTRLTDLFTVEAGPYILLDNFSASITANTLGLDSLVKEFVIHVEADKALNISFSPAMSQSRDSTYAFVNGIEIISVPSSLSYFHHRDTEVQEIGKSLVHVDYNTALEIINRQNFKQSVVVPNGHFDDLFPLWAMRKTNSIKSDTRKISADVGFRYLIRLHFSEHGLELAKNEEVIFKVVINEMIAQTDIDILNEWGDNGIPRYRDYMVTMRGHKKEGRRDILITLQTSNKSIDGRPVLTGFEIFKLSNPDNSLASPNPLPPQQDSPSRTLQTLFSVFSYRNAIAAVAITTISLVNIIVHKLREIWEASDTEEENRPSARAARFCRRFSFAEIQLATRNFNYVIGKGGFGYVYKGIIDNGQETVAVKRLKTSSKQGAREFLTEIEMLSELRHINLVSLIGYCNERGEMILVYEYVANGTLADHLYKLPRESNDCPLTWKQRLNICIGTGRGLDYLHTGHRVIHRDVKASNILLNENFEAKVSDFGLAKPEDRRKLESHVSTNVKGTFGYFDPYYINTRKLTRKSDTYAFGVVLLEVLCGRPAMDSRVAANERFLDKWAQDKISNGEVDQIVDSGLREHISQGSLKTFVAVAERCISDEPKQRPTMAEVVLQLESALVQEQSKQLLVPNEIASDSDNICLGQVTEASIDARNLTPLKEQTNSRVVGAGFPPGREDGREKTHRPPRFWSWDTLWNRWRPSRENDMLLSGTSLHGTNMQNFLQALGRRRSEMSLRRRDIEQWMRHLRLPEELRRQVRDSERFNWAATRGVDEDKLLEDLPEDLQREIRRHLFKYIKNVRVFYLLDEPIVDAICDKLRTKTYIKDSKILFRGCLIDKMVFIIRGKMESIGEYHNVIPLSDGDVCGEELISWCLENSSENKDGRMRIPGHRLLSNRLVRCLTNVEAFVLRAADLEEVAGLFARFLRNPRVQGAIRYESQYWRGLAVRRIQVAWRYRKKKISNRSDSSTPQHNHSSGT